MFAYLLQVYYYIQSDLAFGFYVTISGDGIIMAYQNNSDNQKWFLEYLPATRETVFVSKQLKDGNTRLALDGGAMTVGTQIKVTTKSNPPKTSQKWKIDNKYLQMNGLVMEVKDGGTSDGTTVILNTKSNPENKKQKFSLQVSSFLSMLQSF